MKDRQNRILALGLMMMGMAAACDPVAVVTYRQFGACPGSKNQALVWFQFVGFDNSAGTTSATFDPYQSFITGHQNDGPGLGYIDLGTTGQQAVFRGFPAVAAVTVGPGESVSINQIGIANVTTQTVDGAQEANNTAYFLATSGGLGNKLNSSQTSWPVTDSCDDVNVKNGQ